MTTKFTLDLAASVPLEVPDGPVDVRVLGTHESYVLENVAEDVFDNPIDARWCAEFFADPRTERAKDFLSKIISH